MKTYIYTIVFLTFLLNCSFAQFSPYSCSASGPVTASVGDTITMDLSACCQDFRNDGMWLVIDSMRYIEAGMDYVPTDGLFPFATTGTIHRFVLLQDFDGITTLRVFAGPINSATVLCGASTNGFLSTATMITVTGCSASTPIGSGGNASVCGANSFTFPIRTCASGALRWYENSSGTGTFYTTASVNPTSTTTYYPFCYTTCLSSAGNAVTATYTCPTSGSGSTWTWTGCQSIDWFNDCNWDRGSIPTITSNVIIPNTLNNPLISGTTANCLDITIQSGTGAILNINTTGGGALNVVLP